VEGERFLERLFRLLEPVLLSGGLRPALEQRRALGVPGRSEFERPGQALLRAFDVERERPFAGQGQVADRARLQLLRLLCLAGGAGQLERLQVVVGEHVGQVLGPLARLPLQPDSGRPVAGSTGRAGSARSRHP
jgi:hypothetical protein